MSKVRKRWTRRESAKMVGKRKEGTNGECWILEGDEGWRMVKCKGLLKRGWCSNYSVGVGGDNGTEIDTGYGMISELFIEIQGETFVSYEVDVIGIE